MAPDIERAGLLSLSPPVGGCYSTGCDEWWRRDSGEPGCDLTRTGPRWTLQVDRKRIITGGARYRESRAVISFAARWAAAMTSGRGEPHFGVSQGGPRRPRRPLEPMVLGGPRVPARRARVITARLFLSLAPPAIVRIPSTSSARLGVGEGRSGSFAISCMPRARPGLVAST